MAQHFLLSAAARSLSLAKVMRMSDTAVVENVFLRLRWPDTDGTNPSCPDCGCPTCYVCRRGRRPAALALHGVP